jgi:pimeloyl-ACP methyl ester carboxylesterase
MKRAWIFALLGLAMTLPGKAAWAQREKGSDTMWKHEYATVNGVKLHYVTQGSGQVILFLHGFPEFWYAWKDQIPEFGKTYQAIALDMRGYNLSEKPPKVEDYALPTLVADIKAFLAAVSKGKKAILVAHDWGGAVAWAYAALFPDTLEKLVIINAPHPTVFSRELQTNPDQQKASAYMNFFRSPGAEQLLSANHYAALSSGVFGSSAKPDSFTAEDRKAYIDAWSQPGALTGGLNYYRAAKIGPPAPGSTEKPGGPRQIRAATDHQAHSQRQPLGGPRGARSRQRRHPRVPQIDSSPSGISRLP